MGRFTFNDKFSTHYIDFRNSRHIFLKLQVIMRAQTEAHKKEHFSKRQYPVVSEYQGWQTTDFNGNQQLFIYWIVALVNRTCNKSQSSYSLENTVWG